jgi:hypothetical protein
MSKNHKVTFEVDRDKHGNPYINGHKLLLKYIKECSPPRQRKYIAELIGRDDGNGDPIYRLKPLWREYPTGLVCSFIGQDNRIHYGWSHCNTKLGDRFDRGRALQIALGRAMVHSNSAVPPFDEVEPRIVREELRALHGRSINYYKYLNGE